MRPEDLIDAMGGIDPVYVEEAEQWKRPETMLEKRKYSRQFRQFLPIAACLGIIAAGGAFGLFKMGDAKSMEDATASMESAADESGENVEEPVSGEGSAMSETWIAINEIEYLQATQCSISQVDYSEEYSMEELENYFGVRIVPETLPEGLALAEEPYIIDYRAGGKAVKDNNEMIYRNETGERELRIGVRKQETGELISFATNNLEISTINDTEVTIGHWREETVDSYIAIFEKEGVTFTVQAVNLAENELVDVLKSLLE